MNIALLASNGETVALASRLISSGNMVRTAFADESLPECDWFIFDESSPLSSKENRINTKARIAEALSLGKPVMAMLTENAPVTPKCAVAFSELLQFSSAAAVTLSGAEDILGLDLDDDEVDRLPGSPDDGYPADAALFAHALVSTYELTFGLVYDAEHESGVLYANNTYDVITADSMENAVAELFRVG